MRRILVVLSSILLIPFLSLAQDYIPFPDSNVIWVNEWSIDYDHWTGYTSYCAEGLDTVIDGVTYFEVWECNEGYFAALRNENGKVYIVPKRFYQ